MKYYKLFVLFVLVASSSNKNKFETFDYQKSNNPWITAFKDQVFFSSLRESYQNDTIFDLIGKKDAFNTYDGLDLENIALAKSLAKNMVNNIPIATMCEGCGKDQKYFMANCLHYYQSRELDSIAHAEFEKFKSRQDKLYEN